MHRRFRTRRPSRSNRQSRSNRPSRVALAALLVAGMLAAIVACENPTSSTGSVSDGGTTDDPPAQDPTPPPTPTPAPQASLRGGLVVNELLPDPSGTTGVDTDGNGSAETTDEFVEIYNAGSDPVDAGGLELWDPSSGHWFTVPDGTTVPAGAAVLVVVGVKADGALPVLADGGTAFDAGQSRGIINNAGDNLILLDPTAGAYLQVRYNGEATADPTTELVGDGFPADAARAGEAEDWGDDTDGSSLARNPDGHGDAVTHSSFSTEPASPGRRNAP